MPPPLRSRRFVSVPQGLRRSLSDYPRPFVQTHSFTNSSPCASYTCSPRLCNATNNSVYCIHWWWTHPLLPLTSASAGLLSPQTLINHDEDPDGGQTDYRVLYVQERPFLSCPVLIMTYFRSPCLYVVNVLMEHVRYICLLLTLDFAGWIFFFLSFFLSINSIKDGSLRFRWNCAVIFVVCLIIFCVKSIA